MLCKTKCLEANGRTKIGLTLQVYAGVVYVFNSKGTSRTTSNVYSLNYQQDDKRGFLERVEACVRESQDAVYENEDGSSLRFTEPKPAHVCCSWPRHPCLVTNICYVCMQYSSWNYRAY